MTTFFYSYKCIADFTDHESGKRFRDEAEVSGSVEAVNRSAAITHISNAADLAGDTGVEQIILTE
jgi:hypothetical protein